MPTRVLFVFVLPSGGVDTLNRMRIQALAGRNIEAHLLYFQSGSGLQNNAGNTVFYTGEPAQIGRILSEGHYSAIVVLSFFMQLSLFRELGFRGPIIFEIQGFGPEKVARDTLLAAAPFLGPYADAFLYPHTPHIGRILREGYPLKPMFAFNNPFDADSFRYRKNEGYPRPVLAWIGRLEANKNWRDFLAIAAKVMDVLPDSEAWMFSDPWLAEHGEHEKLAERVRALGIEGKVRQLHNVPHNRMAELYSQIGDSGGVLCMTSQTEGAPYAALEALSCRCPVLTTDSDGVRSSLLDGVTALYFDHGDIDGAAAKALRLMRDRKLRSALVRGGEKHVRENFTLEQYADHFARMLGDLGVSVC